MLYKYTYCIIQHIKYIYIYIYIYIYMQFHVDMNIYNI